MSEEVVVVDVRIPFGSMVILILKWSLASIPAMIIFLIVGMLAAGVMTGIFSAMSGG